MLRVMYKILLTSLQTRAEIITEFLAQPLWRSKIKGITIAVKSLNVRWGFISVTDVEWLEK